MAEEKSEEPLSARWISLREASRLVGVNPSTLRRWADAGQVKSFRTPGGHRRFAEAGLQALMAGEQSPAARSYEELAEAVVGRIRRGLRAQEAPWLGSLDEETREGLRHLGRRLLELATGFLSRPTRRGRLREEARQIGREYGQRLAAAGLSFAAALEAFSFFRRALLDTALEMAQKGGVALGDLADASAQMGELADEVLLALSEAFHRPAAELPQASLDTRPSR